MPRILKIPTANEIFPGLHVGDHHSCGDARLAGVFTTLSVDDTPCDTQSCRHLRLTDPYRMPMVQNEAAGDIVRWIVDRWETNGLPVLVHCGQGMERAPLAIVIYIAWRLYMPVTEAYGWVLQRRPLATIRTSWIPSDFSWSIFEQEAKR